MKLQYSLITVLAFLFAASCAPTVRYSEDIADYEKELRSLSERVKRDSQDAEAIRDLGVIYFQTRNYDQAKSYLTQALRLNRNDPKTLLYVGLSAEFEQNDSLAMAIYGRYTGLSRLSRYRNLMEGRYQWLSRKEAQRQVRQLIQDPAGAPNMDPEAVAVFPLIYQGESTTYAPVGRGLSEMILIDLSYIPSLRLVERIRIQAILNELENARTPYMDPSTSPRHGQLIGAGKIIGGNFNVTPDEQLLVNASYWDAVSGDAPEVAVQQDQLENLFRAQKLLVFELLGDMGIEPTPEQKQQIEKVPTKNLQAFLAYCVGLEKLDAGQFQEASEAFQSAVALDPGFGLARQATAGSESLESGSGSTEAFSEAAREGDELFASTASPAGDAVSERLEQLGDNIGSGFLPGEDNRKPAEEADGSASVPGLLPDPPPPPGP